MRHTFCHTSHSDIDCYLLVVHILQKLLRRLPIGNEKFKCFMIFYCLRIFLKIVFFFANLQYCYRLRYY